MKPILLLTLVVLTGCSGISSKEPHYPPAPENPVVEPWQSWRLSGRISVRNGEEGWFAALRWLQSGNRYRMNIQGHFGQGMVEVVGDAHDVYLRTNDGRLYVDHDAESLIQQVLGVKVPVAGLRYWVHGLADPGQLAQSRWGRDGVRTQLRQAGWIIQYQNYVAVAGRRLPTKIRMDNGQLQIRLQIDDWQKEEMDIPS